MKVKDKPMRVRYLNFTVTIPPRLVPEIKRRAASQELTVSQYLRWLIKSDIKALERLESDDIIK